jgi:hypothetical protein
VVVDGHRWSLLAALGRPSNGCVTWYNAGPRGFPGFPGPSVHHRGEVVADFVILLRGDEERSADGRHTGVFLA